MVRPQRKQESREEELVSEHVLVFYRNVQDQVLKWRHRLRTLVCEADREIRITFQIICYLSFWGYPGKIEVAAIDVTSVLLKS